MLRFKLELRCYDPTTSGPEARATCAHLMCEGVPAPRALACGIHTVCSLIDGAWRRSSSLQGSRRDKRSRDSNRKPCRRRCDRIRRQLTQLRLTRPPMVMHLTSLRFSRASTTSLPSLRFLRVGWKRWLDAHRPRRCTPSRRDARSVSRRAARDPATHTRPIPSAPGRHEHLTATHLASGCDRCTHLMNSTRIPHAGRLADVRLHLTSLGVTRSAPSLPCPSLPHTRCRVDARVRPWHG